MSSDIILLGHGSGGHLTHRLLAEIILPILSDTPGHTLHDAAILPSDEGRLAFTTDSFVVDPIFFPGGCIGQLAVHGTVNDLAMSGALPLAISVGLILEEGLPLADLKQVLYGLRQAADASGVAIVTGDTKVVPRGKCDRIFINTAGIGIVERGIKIGCGRVRAGDQILINGPVGDHGLAVLACRENLQLAGDIRSDSAPLHDLVADLLETGGESVHVLRDPTRGGVATTLKEIALQSQLTLTLDEAALPVRPAVAAACAILGLDPLYIANEGKLLAVVAPDRAEAVLRTMRRHPYGQEAAIIGEVGAAPAGQVAARTAIGGLRSLDMLSGELLPRIC